MRQGQHNKRARGRGRKPQNPANRTYDSNGPDVKIRGTAAHIAEKYQSLARDAQVAGDPISAENYMQHAEHYSRIIAAAQAQMQAQAQQNAQENANNNSGNNGASRGDSGEDDDQQPAVASAGSGERAKNGADTGSDGGDEDEGRQKRSRGRRRPKMVSVEGQQPDSGKASASEPVAGNISEAGNSNESEQPGSSDDTVIAEAG